MSEEAKAIKRLEEMTNNFSLNSKDLHYAIILYHLIINLQKENQDLKEKVILLKASEPMLELTKYINEKDLYKETINKAIEYNNHLIKHAKYHLNLGHLKKMNKILKGEDK